MYMYLIHLSDRNVYPPWLSESTLYVECCTIALLQKFKFVVKLINIQANNTIYQIWLAKMYFEYQVAFFSAHVIGYVVDFSTVSTAQKMRRRSTFSSLLLHAQLQANMWHLGMGSRYLIEARSLFP